MGRYAIHLKKHRFKKGNIPHNKGHKLENSKIPVTPIVNFERPLKDTFKLVTKSVYRDHPDQIPTSPTSARFLRPKASLTPEVKKCAENEGKTG